MFSSLSLMDLLHCTMCSVSMPLYVSVVLVEFACITASKLAPLAVELPSPEGIPFRSVPHVPVVVPEPTSNSCPARLAPYSQTPRSQILCSGAASRGKCVWRGCLEVRGFLMQNSKKSASEAFRVEVLTQTHRSNFSKSRVPSENSDRPAYPSRTSKSGRLIYYHYWC